MEDEELYAPVARMMTLRVLLALAVEYDLKIFQLDVHSAFLKSNLNEIIYMKPPEGLEGYTPNKVCKLVKALYGLRQSPKCWNNFINEHLMDLGLKRSKVDPCLYYTKNTFMLIWVDDFILLSSSDWEVETIKNSLISKMEIRELSNNNKLLFLGLEIIIQPNKIFISQKQLILKILKRFNMDNCKVSKIPIQTKIDLKKSTDVNNFKEPYKELIGSLMYIMLGSHPDLCFSIGYLSRFQNCFNNEHWGQLKNVLRYLKGTENYGLIYKKTNGRQINVFAFTDSDFAADSNDRKSTTGFVIKINKNTVFWNSKKQSVVALSSSEAEYVSLSSCCTECIFLGNLLHNIQINVFPITIYEDNQSAIKMAHTLETKRSKHIDVKHFFVKDLVSNKQVIIKYLQTNEQIADTLTKALPESKFVKFRQLLNVDICF